MFQRKKEKKEKKSKSEEKEEQKEDSISIFKEPETKKSSTENGNTQPQPIVKSTKRRNDKEHFVVLVIGKNFLKAYF